MRAAVIITAKVGRWYYQRASGPARNIDVVGPFHTHAEARAANQQARDKGETVSPVYWAG